MIVGYSFWGFFGIDEVLEDVKFLNLRNFFNIVGREGKWWNL